MQSAISIHGQYAIIVPEDSVVDGKNISSGNVLVQGVHIGLQVVNESAILFPPGSFVRFPHPRSS